MAMLLVPVFCGGLVIAHNVKSSHLFRQLQLRWRQRKANATSESALAEHLDIVSETHVDTDTVKRMESVDGSLLGDMFMNRTFIFLFGTCEFLHALQGAAMVS